jgi:regulator of sigma E protease
MLAILAPILVFGLVIFVHELGHFLAAKAVGVYAPRFSIGFGPPIFKFRRGETEYILAWLPLGGYVRMASRHDAETAFLEGGNEEQAARKDDQSDYDPNAMIPFGPKPVPENRWFESKPLWARIIIMIAGVVMNTVLAVIVATGLALNYGEAVLYNEPIILSTVIGAVRAPANLPQLAEIHPGDSISAVNGQPVNSWNQLTRAIRSSRGSIRFSTQRGDITVPLAGSSGEEAANGLVLHMAPVIDTVFPGDPAAAAGLRSGDSVVAVAGRPLSTWTEMVDQISKSAGSPLSVVVARGGAMDTLSITPKAVTEPDPRTGKEHTVGKIGAGVRAPPQPPRLGIASAVSVGTRLTIKQAGAVFEVLRSIGTGERSVRELGGPIAITRASVEAARSGLADLFNLIALLSINVAVLNLLPIPILDGGQILINVLESAKGSPFSMRTREYILRLGLFAIALLFVIVMYNDTRGAFAKLFGWVGKLFGA